MGRKRLDLVGQKFGKLFIIKFSCVVNEHTKWECKCECGNITIVRGSDLKAGNTISCGCMQLKTNTTHGRSYSREYASWNCAVQRTTNSNNTNWKNYGGRGIKMHPEWRDSFKAFYDYMGPRLKGTSIERLDNNGNYEPGNCVWATPRQQSNNTRRNKKNKS